MIRTFLLMIICCFFSFFSCKTYDSPDNYPERQIVFGSGGGFTGKVQSYTLLENGQLFHHNGISNTTKELEKIDKTKAKDLFNKLSKADIENTKYDDPGNMYYFVKSKKGTKEHSVTWGGQKGKTPEACNQLYKELMSIINERKMKGKTQ